MQNNIPKAPEIKFVATKGDEREEFTSYKELEDWFNDECDKELCDFYQGQHGKNTIGSHTEWVKNTFYLKDIEEWLGDKGWKVERVVEHE